MKISVMYPKSEFTQDQQKRLTSLGETNFTTSIDEYPLKELIKLAKNSDILAFANENIGGFEVAHDRLFELMECMPKLRGLALATTSFGFVEKDYCLKRNIIVTNVPYYSTESVAEHTIALLLGCSKKIFLSDRREQNGKFKFEIGYDLKGKTLGVIGLGHIGTRTAELGKAIGMKVIAWNRTPKKIDGIEMKLFDEVLSQSDAVTLHVTHNNETIGIISQEKIALLKKGAILINTADRFLVDENTIAQALKSGAVDSYALEAEDLNAPPLGKVENAFMFKPFAWYTKEALARNLEIWIDNIEGIIKGHPINPIF